MPKQVKENSTIYVGQDVWINEKITANQIIKKNTKKWIHDYIFISNDKFNG